MSRDTMSAADIYERRHAEPPSLSRDYLRLSAAEPPPPPHAIDAEPPPRHATSADDALMT